MKITLKNLKIAAFLSQETTAFSATVYVDGVKAGTASNDGHGGSNNYYFDDPKMEAKLEAFAATLPKVKFGDTELSMNLDLVIDDLMQKMEEEKRMVRHCKTKTLFLLEGDDPNQGWRTVKSPYNERVQTFLDGKYGSKVVRILNKEIQG